MSKKFNFHKKEYVVERIGYGQYVICRGSTKVHFTNSYVYDTIDSDPHELAIERQTSVTYAKYMIQKAKSYLYNLVKQS